MAKKDITAVQFLRRMKAILRKGWVQDDYAVSARGKSVDVGSARAVKFCLLGAEDRAYHELRRHCCGPETVEKAHRTIQKCLPPKTIGIVQFNDAKGRKKSEVLAVIDCAIKKAATL